MPATLSEEHKRNIGAANSVALWHRFHGEPSVGWYISKHGYKILTGQIHPIAVRYELAEHRKVLYDKIGPGEHACHWCGVMVEWGGRHGIQADHLDRDKLNNDPSNLVPSCMPCNAKRPNTEKTHCVHGHEFDSENTYVTSAGHRQCKKCGRDRKKLRRGRVAP